MTEWSHTLQISRLNQPCKPCLTDVTISPRTAHSSNLAITHAPRFEASSRYHRPRAKKPASNVQHGKHRDVRPSRTACFLSISSLRVTIPACGVSGSRSYSSQTRCSFPINTLRYPDGGYISRRCGYLSLRLRLPASL